MLSPDCPCPPVWASLRPVSPFLEVRASLVVSRTEQETIVANDLLTNPFGPERPPRPRMVKSVTTGTGDFVSKEIIVPVVTSAPNVMPMISAPPSIISRIIPKYSIKSQLTSRTVNLSMEIKTPLKPGIFGHYLSLHPDPLFANSVMDILFHGADIVYWGPRTARVTPNSLSAKIHKKILRTSVDSEVESLHTCGPFDLPPFDNFICSPLFAVPKKNSEKFRVMLNLSAPVGSSINDFIDKDCYSMHYSRIDDAVCYTFTLGKGALMAKLDIKSAFRLIPVRPIDRPLLGYKVDEKFYFDTVLPFGLRSSPFLFCLISEAVLWILKYFNNHKYALCYMGDFLLCGFPYSNQCQVSIDSLISLCAELGVPLAMEKTEGSATVMTFLGIQLDSVSRTLSHPSDTLSNLSQLLLSWKDKTSCSRQELQSLTGHLMFASKCIPSGRLFTRRLIILLSSFSPSVDHISLDRDDHLDV
ncbi:hypothetical protein RvY_03790 [Ramazzottius varieornatus]|uniref:Reverse transcriptase domain-containing protein n=1 Tax=Ramazzottius varieornatus TaxID=947166 RepID=A0A1D1UUY6_RAMVA|nr:hypothetical protein RvY_03790 [Ramazzottius varieornatus]